MRKPIIKKGDKYNYLTAVRFDHYHKDIQYWLFKCECGKEKVINVYSVRNGSPKSCGCLGKYNKKIRCIVCNNIFIPKTINNTKCCSPECSKISQSFEWKVKNLHLIDNFSSYYKLRFEIFKRDNFTCQYCGRNFKEDGIKLHCDHIIPKNSGGKDVPENLITACEECNLGKSDVLLSEVKLR